MRCDILYCEGPGDIVAAHESWRRREQFRSETSVTFSSQVFEFCAGQQLSLYAVSHCPRADRTAEAAITVENKPRWLCRLPLIGYHLSLFIYALRLLVLALRLRPQVILVTSGVVEWGFACLLRLSGAKVVPILHNALWPVGYRPGGLRQWVQERVHRFFWRVCVWQTLAVSAALADQVRATAGAATTPLTLFQPTFSREAFAELPPAAGFEARPFRVLYVGRIEENKGALDLVPIAAELLARCPGGFEFDVCGDGSARAELDARVRSAGLQAHFRLYGRL